MVGKDKCKKKKRKVNKTTRAAVEREKDFVPKLGIVEKNLLPKPKE